MVAQTNNVFELCPLCFISPEVHEVLCFSVHKLDLVDTNVQSRFTIIVLK